MLKNKKKLVESILKEYKWKYIGCIYLYFILSTLLKFVRFICLNTIEQIIVSTIIIVLISAVDYIIYTFVINKSFEIVTSNKNRINVVASLVFAMLIIGFEYIFQYILILINNNVMLMMSITLTLSMLRILYLPFLHFLFLNVNSTLKPFKSVLRSIGLALSNFMEILYFSLSYYFLNLFHNYIVYQLTLKLNISETVNINEIILYSHNRFVFIFVELIFYLLLAFVTSKLYVYLAYLFKEKNKVSVDQKSDR